MSLVDDIKTIQRAVGAIADGVFGPQTAALVLTRLSMRGEVEYDAVEELDERTIGNIRSLDEKAKERFYQVIINASAMVKADSKK
jgi:murein L,D-transpeptidase YcbB/YkuD